MESESGPQQAAQLGVSRSILAWAVRHAAWILTRFQVKSSGKTAHYNAARTGVVVRDRTLREKLCSTSLVAHKATYSTVGEGVYVGISELMGERLICDEGGARAARTIRRRAPRGRWCSSKIRRID